MREFIQGWQQADVNLKLKFLVHCAFVKERLQYDRGAVTDGDTGATFKIE